jgi:phosphoglycerate dehydrogenase-like enzyme
MKVVAWSQNLKEDAAAVSGARLVSKEELLRTADVVSLHTVLSKRTKGIIGAEELAMMKQSTHLVSTSRGPLVVDKALHDALADRQIAGAAIDVYDIELLPQMHLYRRANRLLATPHIGYVSRDLYRHFYQDAAAHFADWLDTRSNGA